MRRSSKTELTISSPPVVTLFLIVYPACAVRHGQPASPPEKPQQRLRHGLRRVLLREVAAAGDGHDFSLRQSLAQPVEFALPEVRIGLAPYDQRGDGMGRQRRLDLAHQVGVTRQPFE